MYIIWFALAAFAGGIVSALTGWLDSGQPFDARTFMSSVLRSLGAGVAGAIAGALMPPATPTALIILVLSAFVSGMGIDAVGHRIAGAIRVANKPK